MNWKPWRSIAMCAAIIAVAGGDYVQMRVDGDRFAESIRDPHDHEVPFAQLDASRASHLAARSGDWSDPGTWSSGVPTAGARVVIPRDVTVSVTVPIAVAALDWVRVEGRLSFSPLKNGQLSVGTVLVTPTGTLSIGAPDRTVDPGKTVSLLFAPRSDTIRRRDHFDMLGGLIVLGHLSIYGAPKAGFAVPSNLLAPGVSRLTFLTLPTGWNVGDELLFPAAAAASEDEQRHIASVSNDRTTITLSSPLRFDHVPPPAAGAEVPVANLTRNVTLASTETGRLHQRAHVMIMTHEPVHISGAMFRGLGRTTAARPHTLTTVNDRGDVTVGENPIGRYAVHFHLVSGASRKMSPHVFTDNVIVDSPKHGLVNHGGYVVAEDNVTFAIHGSHFFAENGSEIGAFRHNLAVFSRGSGEHIEARQAGIGDFGHTGHGFWSNSPAVVMERNYAFHHARSAYVIFAAPVEAAEGMQNVFFRGSARIANFPRVNLDPPLRDMLTEQHVAPTEIPFRFSGNIAANSERGLETWHVNEIAGHNLPSIVEDCVFWEIRSVAIAITYGVNTVVRDSILLGSRRTSCSDGLCDGDDVGITNDGTTRNLLIDNVHVAGFSAGIWVPSGGATRISRSSFDNKFNLLIYAPHQPGRTTIVEQNAFARHNDNGEDYRFLQDRQSFRGDVSMLFARDPLIVTDDRFPGKTLYRPDQCPTAIPFRDAGIPELDGKTADQIRREFGLALGGVLAPVDATRIRGIGGLVGGPPSYRAEMADEEKMPARTRRLLSARAAGWRFLTKRRGGKIVTRLVFVDTHPPRFELDPRIRLEIHPDDVKYGFLIQGLLYDEGAPPEALRRIFDSLRVDDSGYVDIRFEYPDRAGNLLHQQYRLNATPRAARRGSDLFYYLHSASGDPKERDQTSVWNLLSQRANLTIPYSRGSAK
jgi:hypothetical protein